MAEQVKKQHSTQKTREAEPEKEDAKDLQNVALDEDVDELLAEIDGVLEENAEEFVRAYVQKGGQ